MRFAGKSDYLQSDVHRMMLLVEREVHHVLHVAEPENRVEQTASLRSFEVDFLDTTGECCAHEPADNALARAVPLVLRTDVDVHQISTVTANALR